MHNHQDIFQKYKNNPKEELLVLLLQSLQPIIYAVCFKVVKNEADSEDITQNVLIKIIRDVHQLKDVKVILGWVHQIAFYTALEFRREQIKQRSLGKRVPQEEQAALNDDGNLVIHEHILKLDKESQQLILLKFFDNKTFEEIYQITGMAYSTAHYEIQKIISKLRSSLEKAGYLTAAASLESFLLISIPPVHSHFLLSEIVNKELQKVVYKKVAYNLTTLLVVIGVFTLISIAGVFISQKENSENVIKESVNLTENVIQKKTDQFLIVDQVKKMPETKSQSSSSSSEVFQPRENVGETESKELVSSEHILSEKIKKEVSIDTLKKLSFSDENGKLLFEGRMIQLQEGNFGLGYDTQINIVKGSNNDWLVGIISKEYYLNKLQYNSSQEFKGDYIVLTGNAEVNSIILSAYSTLKIKFESKENYLVKDDLKCHLKASKKITPSEIMEINRLEMIRDNSVVFRLPYNGPVFIENVILGSYTGQIYRTIELKAGELIEINVNIEKAKEQIFQVLDSQLRPLGDYYIVFNQFLEDSSIDYKKYNNDFSQTGFLEKNKFIGKTDKNGFAQIDRLFFQEKLIFECLVFGKNHLPQKFQMSSLNMNETIELKLINQKKAKIKVYLNNEPYYKDIGIVTENRIWITDETHKKLSAKLLFPDEILFAESVPDVIKKGELILEKMPPKKIKIRLASNEFIREEYIIDLTEKDQVELAIHLKPAEYFVHGFVQDSQGKPKADFNIMILYFSNSFYIKTDLNGYFKFSGMELDEKCEIYIHDGIVETDLSKDFSPSKEEIKITVENFKNLSLQVIGLDGKPLLEFEYILYIYIGKRSFPNYMLNGNAKNGILEETVQAYGLYHFEIIVPNAPKIILDWPILNSGDVGTKTVYASLGFDLNGIVKDVGGNPIVDLIISNDEHIVYPFIKVDSIGATTNKEGKFKIEKCAVGMSFWLLKVGYSPIRIDVVDEYKMKEVSFVMQKSIALKGKFLNSKNEPYANVEISGYRKMGRNLSYSVNGSVNKEGLFYLEGLTQDKWLISFILEGHEDVYSKEVDVKEGLEDLKIIYDFKLDDEK